MPDLLNKSGKVSITDIKDSWNITLTAGKNYKYEAQNTDNHGQFNLLIEAEELNYGEVPTGEFWNKVEKINVDPKETKTGSFTAPRSVYGLNASNSQEQETLEKISYVRVSVKWVVTVYNADYKIRIYE